MENEQRIIPATYLPEGWAWRLYDDGSGGLYSPENKNVVLVDFATSEYRQEGKWCFMPGYPYETVSSVEFMDSMEKYVKEAIKEEQPKGKQSSSILGKPAIEASDEEDWEL